MHYCRSFTLLCNTKQESVIKGGNLNKYKILRLLTQKSCRSAEKKIDVAWAGRPSRSGPYTGDSDHRAIYTGDTAITEPSIQETAITEPSIHETAITEPSIHETAITEPSI